MLRLARGLSDRVRLYSYGLQGYGLCGYGRESHGLCSYGLWVMACIAMADVVMAYTVMAYSGLARGLFFLPFQTEYDPSNRSFDRNIPPERLIERNSPSKIQTRLRTLRRSAASGVQHPNRVWHRTLHRMLRRMSHPIKTRHRTRYDIPAAACPFSGHNYKKGP